MQNLEISRTQFDAILNAETYLSPAARLLINIVADGFFSAGFHHSSETVFATISAVVKRAYGSDSFIPAIKALRTLSADNENVRHYYASRGFVTPLGLKDAKEAVEKIVGRGLR